MKQVLLVDQTTVFKDYIIEKFTEANITILQGISKIDSIAKMRNSVPDLIILDYSTVKADIFDYLEEKRKDPNIKNTPTILLVQRIDSLVAKKLVNAGLKHIIQKPVKIDQFFNLVKTCIQVEIEIDETPCILEARVNDTIIFIEIAQGLNREKIKLLQYKIVELLNLYNLSSPKVLVMMTDLQLSFIDGANLDLLMSVLVKDQRIKARNIKVLTLDPFIKDFINGDKAFADIEVLNDLTKAMDALALSKDDQKATETISEKILSSSNSSKIQDLEMRFKSEIEALKAQAADYRIAVIDDDITIRTILSKTFSSINASVDTFDSGVSFISQADKKSWDLIFLDLIMPGLNGFEVILKLKEKKITTPIIVLSSVSQREAVMKVLASGVKSYMIKPLKPEAIIKKALEILNEEF